MSDGLAKINAQDKISKFLGNGQRWNLVFDEKFTAAKKLRAAKTAVVNFSTNEDPTWLDLVNRPSLRGMSAHGNSSSLQHIMSGHPSDTI